MPAQDRVGGDRRWRRSSRGNRRTRASNTGWSVQPKRGLGLVRRSTATSCRSTRSSTSLVEDVRTMSRTSPSTCQKIRYSSRSEILRSRVTVDYRWSAARPEFLNPIS
jgi:hypothetical protein